MAADAPAAAGIWVWVKIKTTRGPQVWSMFPLTRLPFGVPIFDPQPYHHPQAFAFSGVKDPDAKPGVSGSGPQSACEGTSWDARRNSFVLNAACCAEEFAKHRSCVGKGFVQEEKYK